MVTPYYQDEQVTLYHGDFREVLPTLGVKADLVVADPPYAETSLTWDIWPVGWPTALTDVTSSMWCFGSMRMFLDRRDDFAAWKLSQDVVWEKQDGSSFVTDRLRRVHEVAAHWYRGPWAEVHHETPRVGRRGPDKSVRRAAVAPGHHGTRGASAYIDNGTRLLRSVIYAQNMHGKGQINETEKPTGLLEPLISYGCPPGGLVVDPFAGSASTLVAARNLGRRAIGVELREEQCEAAARRLAHAPFDFGDTA